MSLAVAGWALLTLGVAVLAIAVVRSHRGGPGAPVEPSPMAGTRPSYKQLRRTVRLAQGRGRIAPEEVETVRTWARYEVEQPVSPALGFAGVGVAMVGAGALAGVSVLGAMWLVTAVVIATLPLTIRRRQARVRRVLSTLPPR